jgi:hypothetical protein
MQRGALVREVFQDISLVLGVIFAGIQVVEGIKLRSAMGHCHSAVLDCGWSVSIRIYQKRKPTKILSQSTPESFLSPRWRIVSGHKFVNKSIDVDGKSFRNCNFENVRSLSQITRPFKPRDVNGGIPFSGSPLVMNQNSSPSRAVCVN